MRAGDLWRDILYFNDCAERLKRDKRLGLVKFVAITIMFSVTAVSSVGVGMVVSNIAREAIGVKNSGSSDVSEPCGTRHGD